MRHQKNEKIVVHIESLYFTALKQIMIKENISASAAGRKAIINYLRSKGLVTDQMIAEISC